MKKSKIIVIAFIAGLGLYLYNHYNSFVELEINAETQWAQVESSYQRRADLIPNLVETVKGYAEFEKSVFVEVTEARSKATSINIDSDDLTPENMAKFQAAQSQLTGSLSRLMATFERYPDLKANKNFLELQAQLEGTENRINVERNRYNAAAGEYNKKTRKLPGKITAPLFGFEGMGLFESEEGAEKAPKVEF